MYLYETQKWNLNTYVSLEGKPKLDNNEYFVVVVIRGNLLYIFFFWGGSGGGGYAEEKWSKNAIY